METTNLKKSIHDLTHILVQVKVLLDKCDYLLMLINLAVKDNKED